MRLNQHSLLHHNQGWAWRNFFFCFAMPCHSSFPHSTNSAHSAARLGQPKKYAPFHLSFASSSLALSFHHHSLSYLYTYGVIPCHRCETIHQNDHLSRSTSRHLTRRHRHPQMELFAPKGRRSDNHLPLAIIQRQSRCRANTPFPTHKVITRLQ